MKTALKILVKSIITSWSRKPSKAS